MSVGELADAAGAVVAAMGIGAAAATLAATRRPLAGLAVLLDFLTAAGLLHLAADPSYLRALSAGILLAIRHLISWSLRTGGGAVLPPGRTPGR
jgi:hypothetical protein